jgi:enoyl-CoA hydratase/carnithine racemase
MSAESLGPAVRVQVAGRTATLMIDHAGRRNALTVEMLDHFAGALTELAENTRVRVVMVTGAGEDFSAGMDIRALSAARRKGTALEYQMAALEEQLAVFPKPTVAAVAGYCVGGGMQLALACDLRVAANSARFGVPPAKLGVVYPAPTIARLVRALGPGAAKRLIFTGELVDAAAAWRLGLVSEVTTPGRLAETAQDLAAVIASRSTISIAAAKEMITAMSSDGIDDAVERKWADRANPDAAVGLEAFLTGRPPHFADQ